MDISDAENLYNTYGGTPSSKVHVLHKLFFFLLNLKRFKSERTRQMASATTSTQCATQARHKNFTHIAKSGKQYSKAPVLQGNIKRKMLEMAEKEHKLKMEILSIKKECALSKIENC